MKVPTWLVLAGSIAVLGGLLLTNHNTERNKTMPAEQGCTWVATGPKMEKHWARIGWNLKHLLDFKTLNPYALQEEGLMNNERTAIQDIGHSLVNLPVEFCRACPYIAGHIWFWQNCLTVVGLGALAWFSLKG